MKVSEILKVKGNILFTVTPDTPRIWIRSRAA